MDFSSMARALNETMLDDGPFKPPTAPASSPRPRPLPPVSPSPHVDLEEDFRDPEWCPWLFAATARLQKIVANVVQNALTAEQNAARSSTLVPFERRRPRLCRDLTIFKQTIEALICHVTYEWLRGAGPVRVALSNKARRRTRYLSPLQSSQLRSIIRLLSTPDLQFLKFDLGEQGTAFSRGRQSTIAAAPRLIAQLVDVELDDIDRRPGEEVVLLKSVRDDRTGHADLIDYVDTDDTLGYRAEVRQINEHLKGACIEYVGEASLVDERDRHMKRRFTRGQFGCGGRLWGGFWQKVKKADRIANVRIDGQRVVSIDLASAVLQFAYAYAGVEPPVGDLYSRIDFTDTSGAPRVLPREIVKKIVAARLNGAKEWPEELREHRPGLPWARVVAALKTAHPPLVDIFDRDLGQELAFTESEVLVDTLLRLRAQGLVALPVHDCVVVPESAEQCAVEAYRAAFTFHTNHTARVTIERAPQE
jgi:hypothetical protein